MTTDEYADDLGTIPVLRRPIHIVTHEDEFALTPREMTTYHRADGEMIADFGWVTDLEWFEDDAWPTELVEEKWQLVSERTFTVNEPSTTCDECGFGTDDHAFDCESPAARGGWSTSDIASVEGS